MAHDHLDVLVVGAGVAGLTCARELQRAGQAVALLDKGRSVGGRCSTWRADSGHLFDYGVTFLHGSDRRFLAELDRLDNVIEGWPRRIVGRGSPCQPRALAARQRRLGLLAGVSALPKHLAAGLEVHTSCRVTRVAHQDACVSIEHEGGTLAAPTLVLAMPCEQARELLAPLAVDDVEIASVRRLLRMLGTVGCLTVLATFDREPPDWHLLLPESSPAVQLVSNESSKRPELAGSALVIQARPGWSAVHQEQPPARWAGALLGEAAGLAGEWVAAPAWSRPHRWRYARTDLATELAGPILLQRDGAQLGLAGELFARGAGVEAAYISGRALARRIIGVDHD